MTVAEHEKYVDICYRLLLRSRDAESSIRKLILKTFEQMWFSADNPIIAHRVLTAAAAASDLPKQKTARTRRKKTDEKQLEPLSSSGTREFTADFHMLVLRMVAVVSVLPDNSLVELLKDLQEQNEDKDDAVKPRPAKQQSKPDLREVCTDICGAIAEALLDTSDTAKSKHSHPHSHFTLTVPFALAFASVSHRPYRVLLG